MEPLSFDSADVEQVEAFVSKIYSKMRIGAVGPSTRAKIGRQVLTPGIGFDDLDYSFDIGYSADPQGRMIICDVVSNTIRRVGEGCDETFGPGDQFLISRPGLAYGGVGHSCRLRFTLFDPALLARVVTIGNDKLDAVRILDHRPVSPAAVSQLRRAIAHVRDEVLSDPEIRRSPLVVSTATDYLAASVFHAFPNTALPGYSSGVPDGHPATLRRAVAHIEAHADTDLTVVDIAAAARVTTRALQHAFRRHLGITPMAYLRRVRLDAAHHDLHAADPTAGDTVTQIAARWGFAHPGRFADAYRKAYGQAPSATLRQ